MLNEINDVYRLAGSETDSTTGLGRAAYVWWHTTRMLDAVIGMERGRLRTATVGYAVAAFADVIVRRDWCSGWRLRSRMEQSGC